MDVGCILDLGFDYRQAVGSSIRNSASRALSAVAELLVRLALKLSIN